MWQSFLSQSDTIFPKKDPPFGAQITEIGETVITYKKKGSSLNYTIAVTDVQKVLFTNGRVESYPSAAGTKEKKETIIPKTKALTKEQKTKIEKLAIDTGKKIGTCALGKLANLATFVDWRITQYDPFNPPTIIIYLKIMYDRDFAQERDYAYLKVTLNEEAKTVKWKLLNCSSKADGLLLIKCQRKTL